MVEQNLALQGGVDPSLVVSATSGLPLPTSGPQGQP
jgi:hypothetical protein